ncbi:MAG TPA: hypothetical protein VF263_03080, partial [Longimicrobiaceae bacterium]
MILACGVADEPVLRWFLAHLVANGDEFHFLDDRDLGERARLDLRVVDGRPSGRIDYGAWSVELDSVTGVFNRSGISGVGGGTGPDRSALRLFLETFPGPVVNRPSAASNLSKPCQYGAILHVGLDVPPTLAGGGSGALRAFRERYGPLVVKSTSSERSVVKVPSAAELDRLDGEGLLPPHQFQARLRGTNVRVHVVGSRALACRMETEALDYRYAASHGHSLRFQATRLPERVEEACVRLAALLSLNFAGIDLLEDE